MTAHIAPLVFVMAEMVRPQPGHYLLFSFDWLMDEAELHRFCPSARHVASARLLRRRLVANTHGLFTVTRSMEGLVHGVVWEIADRDQPLLEAELNALGLVDRRGAFVRDSKNRLVPVEYLASPNHRLGQASHSDTSRLTALATHWGFPGSYRDEIVRWAPAHVESETPTLVR